MGLLDKIKPPSDKAPEWGPVPSLLLMPNIPKPMSGVCPRVVLGQEWWDVERKRAYAATEHHCKACGVSAKAALEYQRLEGHEVFKINYTKGRMYYVETVALCHYCHCFIHDGRMKALFMKNEITVHKLLSVHFHGMAILQACGLERPDPYTGLFFAPWEKWRMVIDGKEYPPLYKTEQEWANKFGLKTKRMVLYGEDAGDTD